MQQAYDAMVSGALRRDGYVVLRSVLSADDIAAILAGVERRLAEARKDPTWRSGGTLHLDVGDLAEATAASGSVEIASAVAAILGKKVPAARVHYRAPLPGHGAQALHADWPEPIAPGQERVATAIVALVAFTHANGATRLVPGSHRLPRLATPANPDIAFPGERIVTCDAGDAIVFTGHLRHGGTRNNSNGRRDSLQILFEAEPLRLEGNA